MISLSDVFKPNRLTSDRWMVPPIVYQVDTTVSKLWSDKCLFKCLTCLLIEVHGNLVQQLVNFGQINAFSNVSHVCLLKYMATWSNKTAY